MTPEEFLSLDWMGRFKRTTQTIKESRTVWMLKYPDGSYVVNKGSNRTRQICVWGEEEHAQYNCNEEWLDTTPISVTLDVFAIEFCSLFRKNKIGYALVSVMNNRRGKEITLAEFLEKVGIEPNDTANDDTKFKQEIVPMPIDDKILESLFDYLNERLSTEDCKNDLTMTIAFLKKHGVKNLDNAIAWLQSKGGYCDCEVLANVEE